MEKTPTPEQAAFLQMLKSCIKDGFIKVNVRTYADTHLCDGGFVIDVVDTTTELLLNLGDESFEAEIGSYKRF